MGFTALTCYCEMADHVRDVIMFFGAALTLAMAI